MGLVVPQHVGSSQARDRTYVSSIGRQILFFFFNFYFSLEDNYFTIL